MIRQSLEIAFQEGLNSVRHLLILLELRERGRPIAIGRLAEAIRSSPQTLTTAIDGLARKGFVTRTRCAYDRKAVLVELTSKGERVAADLAVSTAAH